MTHYLKILVLNDFNVCPQIMSIILYAYFNWKNIENFIDVLHILPQYIFHNISCKLLFSSVLDNSNSNGII